MYAEWFSNHFKLLKKYFKFNCNEEFNKLSVNQESREKLERIDKTLELLNTV